jgi:general secretion pathway protein J
MENDLRNALAYDKKPAFGDNIPAMQVGGQEYWLIFLRGGHANPLNLVRSELMRVAYRIDDEVLWRYSWTDPHSIDEDSAQKQKLMEGVEEVAVRVLSPDATSFSGGPWTDTWPAEGVTNQLPKAIEITLTFTKAGELMRLMALAPGN